MTASLAWHSMSKTIAMKNNELVAKQGEMTALKAKLFNEEKLIREKQKKMQKDYEEKIGVLTRQVNQVCPPTQPSSVSFFVKHH